MSVYATADFHGFITLYEEAKKVLKPEDRVIFLGDAADRGPFGWSVMKMILDDPQWEYILGNHDLFMIKSILGPEKMHNMNLWSYNGGFYTYDEYCEDELSEEEKRDYLVRLRQSKLYEIYTNKDSKKIFLSHSGAITSPWIEWIDVEDFVWDRNHIYEKADDKVDLIVHGHTPIRSLIHRLNENAMFYKKEQGDEEFVPGQAFWYADKTKIDIDQGTIVSGFGCLLDLDTFESIPLEVQGLERDFLWDD